MRARVLFLTRLIGACMAVLLSFSAASADDDMDTTSVVALPEIVVEGERLQNSNSRTIVTADPAALPASTTIVDSAMLQRTPIINSYVDLFRPLPGFNVSNLGQGGIGNGISIRGFADTEHGRDVAYFIDGIPINEVSSIHTPNYADLNILIPETVERVEVIRGPFSALYGDSNLGGSVNIITKRFDSSGQATISGGYFNTARGMVMYSQARKEEGKISPLIAFEGFNTDGYRENQNYRRYNIFGKATMPTKYGDFSIRGQLYQGEWGAPGYLNRDLVQSGLLNPRTAVNSFDGGHKNFQNITLNYLLGDFDRALSMTGFINHDTAARFADFGGGQRVQDQDRTTMGFTIRKVWTGQLFGRLPAQLLVGTNFRNDSVNVSQNPTINREISGPAVRNINFTEQGWGQYVQAQVKPVWWLKLTGGSRYDHFWYDVDDRLATRSVAKADTGTFSPKGGIAISPTSWIEVFANYGEGFRSPSAVDDVVGTPNVKPSKLRTYEAGVSLRPTPQFTFRAAVWSTTLNQELFQPAPGIDPQNIGRSRREGYDIESKYFLHQDQSGLASLFVNYSQIRAKLLEHEPAVVVPNVPTYLISIGSDVDLPIGGANSPHRIGGQLYIQFIGKKNLTEDGVLTTKPYQRVAGRFFYAHQSGWTGFIDMSWFPSDRLSETALNFGNPTGASSSDIFVSPQAPFMLQGGVSYRFKT